MKKNLVKSTVEPAQEKPQSKVNLAFQKLLSEIEKRREQKDNLEKNLKIAQARIERELRPLQVEGNTLLRKYLLRLDQLATEIGVSNFYREWFESFMSTMSKELLDDIGYEDKEIFELFSRYSGQSMDEIIEDEVHIEMAEAISDLLGFDIDIKEFLEKGEKQFLEDHKKKIAQSLQDKANVEEDKAEDNKPEKSKLNPEESLLKKDARNVYMRLVKNLHPDLEPDESKKAYKTELVKQVTEAYQQNDFFNLLKLQIEHLEEGGVEAEKQAEDMLKRYNKILKRQLAGIMEWIDDINFFEGDIIEDFLDKNLKFSPQKFSAAKKRLEKEVKLREADFLQSMKRPKTWFKEQMKGIKAEVEQTLMEEMFFDMFKGKF